MLSHFYDPFFDDPFLSTRMNRMRLGDQSNQGLLTGQGGAGALTTPASNRGWLTGAEDAGWLNFNRLLEEPLQLEVQNKDKEYELIAKRPQGIRRKDLHVEVNGNILTISGERSRSKHRPNMEREDYVNFSRSMTLPEDIHLDQIKATYDDQDNLHITLPKLEGRGPRQILIGGGQNQTSGMGSSSANLGQKSDNMQTDKTQQASMGRGTEPRTTNAPLRNQ